MMIVSAVGCCFWPNTAGYLGPCEPECYHDEGSKTCFSTFLVFLFALLRAELQYLFVHMLVDCFTLWQELEVNNTPCIKDCNQHDLDF